MAQELATIIYPVKDLAKAKKLYSALLGKAPAQDSEYYVGFQVGTQQFGLDPNGHSSGLNGPVTFWTVTDIRQSLKALLEAGAEMVQEVKDVGGGLLMASVKDADNNDIGLMQNP
jgi:predicted enzyme related to lactoylglutathione lyase